jgi:hypothetical protein
MPDRLRTSSSGRPCLCSDGVPLHSPHAIKLLGPERVEGIEEVPYGSVFRATSKRCCTGLRSVSNHFVVHRVCDRKTALSGATWEPLARYPRAAWPSSS